MKTCKWRNTAKSAGAGDIPMSAKIERQDKETRAAHAAPANRVANASAEIGDAA